MIKFSLSRFGFVALSALTVFSITDKTFAQNVEINGFPGSGQIPGGNPVLPQATEVSIYGVFKNIKTNQTDVGTFSPATNPNRISAFVVPTSNGSVTAASVTPPSGGSVTSSQSLSNQNDGTGIFVFQAKFADQTTLDSNYADGTYHMSITGASSTVYTANNLVLTGGVYPSTTPTVTNTNWSGGSLVVDPSAPFTLNWGAFSGATANDKIVLSLQNTATGQSAFFQFLPSSTTSQTFVANFFQPNQTYQASIDFLKVATTDTTDISGATGLAAYARETGFTIQTIPEPSTIAMLFLGFGCAGAFTAFRRRRHG